MSLPALESTTPREPATLPDFELLNYRLHQCLGQDELTVCYAATHLTLDRPVHVYILRRPDWVSVSRFQLAGRLLARLSHPNLLPVIDAGHDDRYGDYIVTPALQTQSLAELLRDGPLDCLSVVRLATQLGAVLDYLHEQGIIHRDIQPATILLTPQQMVYVTNLSLAASPDAPDFSSVDEADYLTIYSAPEQHLDQSESSPTVDVYSLGSVLYHAFTGKEPPPPGSDLPSLAQRDPALKSADRVLQRMRALQPEGRFASAGEAVAALRHALRRHLDSSNEDMEESRWEPTAQWLENPLETVLLNVLVGESPPTTHSPNIADTDMPHPSVEAIRHLQDYCKRSRARANTLHRGDTIRRLLTRWSRVGFFRRPLLGRVLELEQVVSYNVYFYDLRTAYETRTPQEPRRRMLHADEEEPPSPPPSLWDTPVPEESSPFAEVKPQEVIIPRSATLVPCSESCRGTGEVVCQRCDGKGIVEKARRVRDAQDRVQLEPLSETCPTCQGYGRQRCATCGGHGTLVEEQVFTWSRTAHLWQNTDDLEGLPRLALQQRLEPVCHTTIDPYEGHWQSVVPLAELLQAAIAEVDSTSRFHIADLTIWGVPVTEVDYQLHEKTHRLYIVGFDNEIVGTWALYHPERIALAAIGLVILLLLVAWAITMLI